MKRILAVLVPCRQVESSEVVDYIPLYKQYQNDAELLRLRYELYAIHEALAMERDWLASQVINQQIIVRFD